jgi:deoxyadenosine/deoxycytidine kinase
MWITIDANIGAGKSTLLRELSRRGIPIDLEPLDEWAPFLEKLSKEPTPDNIFLFQQKVIADRAKPRVAWGVIERSLLFQEKVFVRNQVSSWSESQVQEIVNAYRKAQSEWSPSMMVYLRTNPESCLWRAKRRAGPGDDVLTLEYLQRLHDLHEIAAVELQREGIPILIIDAESNTPIELADQVCSAWNPRPLSSVA